MLPKPVAATLPVLKKRTITGQCAKHGSYEYTQRLVFDEWTGADKCPACEEAEKREEHRRLREAEEQRQRELKRKAFENRLRVASIPQRFQDRTLETYRPCCDKAQKVYDLCLNYVCQFAQNRKMGRSMIFCGTTGSGKTHLACGIAHALIATQQYTALYVTAARMMRMVKDTYRRDSVLSEQQAIERIASPDLLIIDEIGVQHGSDTERNILFDVINERYERVLPTIVVSNLAMDDLRGFTGDRVIDRLAENGGVVRIFDWQSNRRRKH